MNAFFISKMLSLHSVIDIIGYALPRSKPVLTQISTDFIFQTTVKPKEIAFD